MAKTYILVASVAYLLGSIPFGYILVKLFLKQDIRQTGSGNIGATNVARSGNKALAIATLLLDAGKGALAVILVFWFFFVSFLHHYQWAVAIAALAALFAILGHCFPVWLKFKGGKGVATGVGAFAIFAPKAVLVAIAVFVLVLLASKYVSLSSIFAAAFYPPVAYLLYPDYHSIPVSLAMVLASCVIIFKHNSNIRRLIAGTEDKFGGKPKGPLDVERSL